MSITSSIAGFFGYTKQAYTPGPWDDFWYKRLGSGSSSGIEITSERAMQLAVVYACVRVISQTIASLPLLLYRRLPNGGKERATDHPLYKLLHDRPNRWQSSYEFIEMLSAHGELRGNGICEKIFNRSGEVVELLPLHPDRVMLEQLDNGTLKYTYQQPSKDAKILHQDQVLHIRGLSTDSLWGMSPIAQAKEGIGLAVATELYGSRFFKNNARPSVVLNHPGHVSPEAANRLRESWKRTYGGDNVHNPAILEEGMEIQEMSVKNDEAQFLETRKYQAIDIGTRIFGLPPHMYGEMDRATFSNIEQQAIEFVVHTIRPRLVRMEKAISRDLIGDSSDTYFVEFLIDGLLRGDAKSRAESLRIQFMNGALGIDEWRAIENRNPLPDDLGKKHYVPLNLGVVGEEPQEEPIVEPVKDDKAAYQVLIDDVACRLASAEIRELEKRADKAEADRAKFNTWLMKFYDSHFEYAKRAIEPLAAAWETQTGSQVDLTVILKQLTKEPCETLLTSDPVLILHDWQTTRQETISNIISEAFNEKI